MAAALATVVTELLDLAEQAIDVAGVFAQQTALEHQRVLGRRQVTDFAPATDTLIGIDADDAERPVVPADGGDAHVGDFEVARVRRTPDVIFGTIAHFLLAFFHAV